MIDLFKNSSELTKIIIVFFWIVVGFQMYRIFLWNILIQLLSILFLYTLYYFIIDFFTGIPFKIYFAIYLIPSLVFALLFFLFHKFFIKPPKPKPLVFIIKFRNGKEIKIDSQKGVTIQGAAGSGKTASFVSWMLKHYGEQNVGGILYDYKDFELVEMANYFYRDSEVNLLPFAPYNPSKSIQYNPLDYNLIKTDEDIKIIANCIVDNVIDSKGERFFRDAALGAIVGVIYTLKEYHKQYCSFSYLIAIFVQKDIEGLISFIKKSEMAKINAGAFLDSEGSDKQMAAVKGSLSNAFSQFANPNIIYTMQKNSVDFALNEKENKSLFCAINVPKYRVIYSPILSVVVQSLIMKMSVRNREKSIILLDEAPTLKINDIGNVPATMRSFGVATIYMLQDSVQAVVQMGRDQMKVVLSNLSTKCLGKTNDPDTAKLMEQYFDEKIVKQVSTSYKSGGFGSMTDRRKSVSERKEKEHKAHEMFKRDTGEFFIFDDKGKSYNEKILLPKYELIPSEIINTVSQAKIDFVFKNIMKIAKEL